MITVQENDLITWDEWLLKKNETIGASESSVIVFGSKYSSNLEIFYQKIGEPRPPFDNIRTFLGRETEDISEKLWSNFDGRNQQSIVENVKRKTPVKQSTKINCTFFNDKYPHLSATPDRRIEPFGKFAGMGYGSLEIKNTQTWVLNSYGDALPPENVVQLCQQMMLTEWDYGELFYFIDNLRCENHYIKRTDLSQLEETILLHTIPFWDNVKKARPIYNQMYEARRTGNNRLADKLEKDIIALEPPAQNTDGYRNFLTQRFKDKLAGVGILPGTPEQFEIAKAHKKVTKEIDALEVIQRKHEIELKMAIANNSMLDFGKGGKVMWVENKNGTRNFKNNIKI